ncbi:putative hydrolase [Hysterangium stoloniferum]|nr:putative hydrolase [Hysterangium stoloniferum]
MAASTSVEHRFLRYRPSHGAPPAVGLVNDSETVVTAILNPATGMAYSELFDLIEDYPQLSADHRFEFVVGSEQQLSLVEKLAPLTGRDIICIGKNYVEHAKEFNQSGFDASDKKDQPEFPVFFTKRASSIVPDGHPIYLHPTVTSSVDYEGELGVIIGKGGIGIKKEDAWSHVWGAVIINDVTARERQRDHKQFFIGKSLDSFCPMGSYVVPSSSLSFTDLHLTTKVNGEVRQSQNTSELIFDIPTLIETASSGITLHPGDVIATGTPYGTGMAKPPGVWLKEGDIVEISIPPLGVLRSPVAAPNIALIPSSPVRTRNAFSSFAKGGKVEVGSPPKALHIQVSGAEDGQPVIFFHGLGGSLQNYKAVIEIGGLEKTNRVILFDLEGHGLSPLSLQGRKGLSITQFADDGKDILDHFSISKAHVVGHSMGGMIAAAFATRHPERVKNLLLLGPALYYGPEKLEGLRKRAELAEQAGMSVIAETLSGGIALSRKTLSSNPLVKAVVQHSVAGTPVEGYTRACRALADAPTPDFTCIKAEKVVIVAGKEDQIIPKSLIDQAESYLPGSQVIWIEDCGHWHVLEDIDRTAEIFKEFLRS